MTHRRSDYGYTEYLAEQSAQIEAQHKRQVNRSLVWLAAYLLLMSAALLGEPISYCIARLWK
jgi:hypothetical protein